MDSTEELVSVDIAVLGMGMLRKSFEDAMKIAGLDAEHIHAIVETAAALELIWSEQIALGKLNPSVFAQNVK